MQIDVRDATPEDGAGIVAVLNPIIAARIYTVLDTGPAVQGRQVDLYMWSCNEALEFGRQPIRLTVLRLGWNPRQTTPTSSSRSRFRSAWEARRSNMLRSNIGSGRDRLGKFPSTAPITTTMSNSSPAIP